MHRDTARSPSSLTIRTLAACLAFSPALVAQTQDDGALWAMWVGQGRLGEKDSSLGNWRWWLDAQLRWRDEGETYDAGIFGPGIGYAITDRVTAHFGYAWIDSDPAGRPPVHEDRLWQQLTWNLPVDGFTLQSRTRLEERFIEDQSDEGWRLRQFFKLSVPFTEDRRWYLSAWDEGFYDLGDTRWGQREGFRQNRAFLGLGRVTDSAPASSVEVGYLNQWLDRVDSDRVNHVLFLMYSISF